jgi:hypothetical protein
VNLGLLKLYKTYPATSKDDTIFLILAKALAVLPCSDFSMCLALLPKKLLVPADKNVQFLMTAASNLELALYKDFWESLGKGECDLFDEKKVPGILSAIRGFIVSGTHVHHKHKRTTSYSILPSLVYIVTHILTFFFILTLFLSIPSASSPTQVINISFDEVPQSVLEVALNMTGADLQKVIDAEGYTKKGDGLFSVPLNSENQARPKKFQENISLQNMMGVIQLLSK